MYENIDSSVFFYVFDLPINITIFSSWIVMAVLMVFSFLATRFLTDDIQTSRWQTLMEMIVIWLRKEIKETSNDNPAKYLGLAIGLFMFILVSNLLTIFPWFDPPTASLSTTIAFALVVFFAIPYHAIQNAGVVGYLRKFVDPSPIMLPMNLFSEVASTFSMALRLFGNMLSGAMFASILTSFVPLLLPLSMQILGLLTGSIQAYIFALLAVVYMSNVGPTTPYVEEERPTY